MREFEVEDWASGLSKEVVEHLQQAILLGAKYKELYEKLLYEKNILISCLCSGKMDVIGLNNQVLGEDGKRRQVTTYHVRVAPLENDNENTEEAVWGFENGKIIEGYSCYSPYSAVQWMLTEMKKWEETK